jgi:hypothetical protein
LGVRGKDGISNWTLSGEEQELRLAWQFVVMFMEIQLLVRLLQFVVFVGTGVA